MNKIKLAIFDIDGTLVDTTELFLQAYEYTMHTHNLGVLTREKLKQIISVSKNILESYKVIDASGDFETYTKTHQDFRHQNIHLAEAFPNTITTLQQLRKHNITIVGLTNRVTLITEVLDQTGLTNLLEVVLSPSDTGAHKPDPVGIFTLMKKYKVKPEETAMIGDTPVDIQAGKAAKVALTIGVVTGFANEDVQKENADYIVGDIQDVLPILLENQQGNS